MPELSIAGLKIPVEQIGIRSRPHDQHRLMRYDRLARRYTQHAFADIADLLPPHALIVINNSQVTKSVLNLDSNGERRIQILNPTEARLDSVAIALAHETELPAEFAVTGGHIRLHERSTSVALGILSPGDSAVTTLPAFLERYGEIPLPTYIASERVPHDLSAADFQTCYARVQGSLSCPTAGLHFTPALMEQVEQVGHEIAEITLHIGYGSWDSLETHGINAVDLNAEQILVPVEVLQALWRAKREKRPVVAVGTSCVRTLESITDELLGESMPQEAIQRTTSLFIQPPYVPQVVDVLLTDFAYPQTPVMMMTAAFTGLETLGSLYHAALDAGYMFDIFGDALLITQMR